MNIYVSGEPLDMPKDASVSMHSSRIRFSGALSDSYTTDIELPKTPRNMRLLGAFMILEGNEIGYKIPANISIGTVSTDGYVSVTEVTPSTIVICAFLSRIPTSLLDQQLSDILVDSEDTILPWDQMAASSRASYSANYGYWLYGQGVNDPPRTIRPSIKLDYLMQLISSATGVSMPTVYESVKTVITPMRSVESRGNMHQVIAYRQHTYFDLDKYSIRGSSPWSVKSDAFGNAITFTANAHLRIRIKAYQWSPQAGGLQLLLGSTSGRILWSHSFQYLENLTDSIDVDVQKGQMLTWTASGIFPEFALDITYSDINEADDEEHEIYYFEDVSIGGETFHISRIGLLANLPDVSLRQLLDSLCWNYGKEIKMESGAIVYVDADASKAIDGRVNSLASATDILARTITMEDSEGMVMAARTIADGVLDSSKTMHKSIFYYPRDFSSSYQVANYEEYSLKDDGTVEPSNIKGAPLTYLVNAPAGSGIVPSGIYLRQAGINNNLLVAPSRAISAEIETYDDVSGMQFVTIDQHKFAIVETDTDSQTRLTTIKAILV